MKQVHRNRCLMCEEIIVNRKTPYNPPSPGGGSYREGEIHPHLNPLPSRERHFNRVYRTDEEGTHPVHY